MGSRWHRKVGFLRRIWQEETKAHLDARCHITISTLKMVLDASSKLVRVSKNDEFLWFLAIKTQQWEVAGIAKWVFFEEYGRKKRRPSRRALSYHDIDVENGPGCIVEIGPRTH